MIDEVAGQWIALLFVPADPAAYGIGFVLFRLFDVAKPWPVCLIDRRVKGGVGVMLDDAVAGGSSRRSCSGTYGCGSDLSPRDQ